MSSLKPIQNVILTEDLIDLIPPNEGIILLTRAWAQYGDNYPICLPTYTTLKKLLNKSDKMKRKILRNHMRKYIDHEINEKSNDVLFYIPPNGDLGFCKIKREHIPDLKSSLDLESLDALKVVLSQFQVNDEEWTELLTKEQIIHYIIRNV
jgi:hypothetical protein